METARPFRTSSATTVTDAETIDALQFHLMAAQDKCEALSAENEELRVKNVMLRRQVEAGQWHMDFMEWASR